MNTPHDQAMDAASADQLMPVIGKVTASLIEILRVFVGQGETLLISGPTGAGKSRLARWCHYQSPRRDQPFVTLDLLSVPADLQMAEIVGWKRGAFTGASNNVAGALARAAGGTLFIDEIDKLSLEAQAGLLRVLEERRYRVLGDDTKEQRIEAQFIIGTNTDLRAAVREGRFREDLYYRINVLPVRLPPLAERLDEVPGWATFMLARCNAEAEPRASLTPQAIEELCAHPWPGNLRQLDNVIRRSSALALAERRGESEGVALIVDARHIERALAFEGADEGGLSSQLWLAARAIASEAVRRERADGEPLSLELMDGFRGLVLGATVKLLGSREQAFRLFKREHLLEGRNHHRELKRQLSRAGELVKAIGDDVVDPELEALLDKGTPKRRRADEERRAPAVLEIVR